MQKNKRKAKVFNDLSIGFFLLSSLVMLLLPAADMEKHPMTAVFAGCMFWAGLLGGVTCYCVSGMILKKENEYQLLKKKERIGALHPGATPEGLAVDIAFIPGMFVTIGGSFFLSFPVPVMLIGMWITILAVYGHFVLNGRVYKFLHPRDKGMMQKRTKFKRKKAEEKKQLEEGA